MNERKEGDFRSEKDHGTQLALIKSDNVHFTSYVSLVEQWHHSGQLFSKKFKTKAEHEGPFESVHPHETSGKHS